MGSYYATGKRKKSVARVWLTEGKGIITVNELADKDYFLRDTLGMIIRQPFDVTNTGGRFDVIAHVKGGGLRGQAEALRHGIAQAIIVQDSAQRPVLRKEGLLTRDPRMKERKKYGRKKARRSFQFTKR